MLGVSGTPVLDAVGKAWGSRRLPERQDKNSKSVWTGIPTVCFLSRMAFDAIVFQIYATLLFTVRFGFRPFMPIYSRPWSDL